MRGWERMEGTPPKGTFLPKAQPIKVCSARPLGQQEQEFLLSKWGYFCGEAGDRITFHFPKSPRWFGKRAPFVRGVYELVITVCNYIHDNGILLFNWQVYCWGIAGTSGPKKPWLGHGQTWGIYLRRILDYFPKKRRAYMISYSIPKEGWDTIPGSFNSACRGCCELCCLFIY